MLWTVGGRPGLRRFLVSYFIAASLRCQASSVAGVVVEVQDGEPGDYSCARRTPPSPTAGQGWMFETEVAPATASQQLASLMDAHAYHDLVGVISLYWC